MIVLAYTHYFYFSVFLIIFRCLSFKPCYKLVLLGLERSLSGIFVWIVVKTMTNLVWASKGYSELSVLHNEESAPSPVCWWQKLPGRQRRWGCHSGRHEGLRCVKLATVSQGSHRCTSRYLPAGGVHLTFPVGPQWEAGGKWEKLSLNDQVLVIWDQSLEKLGLTSSVVPRHSSPTSASLTCGRLLYQLWL